jgi:hypothetical protein
MKYADAGAFRRALEQRLLARSRDAGESLSLLRKLVVFDRLLARLLEVAPHRWVLKGALALSYMLGTTRRLTKDADLVRSDDESAATSDFLKAQAIDLDDPFSFLIEKVGVTDQEPGASAVRYRVRAELAGRLFEEVLIDVGFLDPIRWPAEPAEGPDLLGFADIRPVTVPTLPLEQQLSEKVHAYTRIYGDGAGSSRVKDLADIVFVSRCRALDGPRLREALEKTFEARATHAIPDALPKPPADWKVPYRTVARQLGIGEDLAGAHQQAGHLLDPVLAGRAGGRWDPERGRWVD